MQQHVTPAPRPRMIVGISGATGIIFGLCILEVLRRLGIETHLVMSKPGERTLACETDLKVRDVRAMADFSYADADIGAAIASGSFRTMGMIVAPCSARSLSAIATGNTDGLLTRAADVCLKERRRVVLMFRETPLHAGHIRAMAQATENGAIVFPPVPAFYDRPASLSDMVNHTVGRVLDLFDVDAGLVRRWSGKPTASTPTAGTVA
ncbi:UbiX family flavin prenyltransferase [Xanthobacter dioxanivorans]|uniref:Flavin prenyltransferase UbiX n=1 Tax=Xanthobacter dioxanivorans TaxID=2528964 RepID=A0A974PJ53_9HYPH|nr:UbiX family flavin prenyltransferase [Xanthobacter dioxanivorans]QRG04590.1 UbiX family flavin prenyltransferase [Xanthobacter dioxanivorans]